MDLLFVDTNGVGLPGGISHMAAIAKYGAGQVDFLFLDSLYKVLENLSIFCSLCATKLEFITWTRLFWLCNIRELSLKSF